MNTASLLFMPSTKRQPAMHSGLARNLISSCARPPARTPPPM
eukprot:CAMPEP_0183460068 /NCGR_PEP_ID=MMETSP0370-20130417/136845_1 /TAXON_ID=268820 /ORGANISM="Peridinium aciculiferum, Strain PAER-2" /LENGTH=41 /DNA_ID= /DNA_START= /DNA_END= /DNA_ORIENTATION=